MDTKIIMLRDGAALIAEIEYLNEIVVTETGETKTPYWIKHKVIRIHHPHGIKLVPIDETGNKMGVILIDWLMFTAEDWIDLNTTNILYLEEPDPAITKMFKEKKTGLALPPEGIVTP